MKGKFIFSLILFQFLLSITFLRASDFNPEQYPQLTNIPTLYINTNNSRPITSKETYIPGTLTTVSSDPYEVWMSNGSEASIEIRGRGNATWSVMPKKPYRIKFPGKTNFLNMQARAKSWVLLANYAEKSLIRNDLAFKVSRLVGMEFTPESKFVDVVLNGEYIGNYQVTDQIEVHENRVPVEEQNPNDLRNISGGYLLEIDGYASGEPVWFNTRVGMPISIKYPKDDEILPQQISYITAFIQQFEDILFSSGFKDRESGYRSMVDTTSLINWYICCELTGNSDSFWSTNIYKKKNIDKIFFGPVWDFDLAFNNDRRLADATEKLMREHAHNYYAWIRRIWLDEWFRGAVNRRWKELINDEKILDVLQLHVDSIAQFIDESQQINYERWKILNSRVHNEQNLFSTYGEYIADLKSYLNRRVEFLTKSFSDTGEPDNLDPFVAESFYYHIQNVRTNNVIQVKDGAITANAILELWAPIPDDTKQEWKIVPVDDELFMIINRKSGLAMTGNGYVNNLIQLPVDVQNTAQQWNFFPIGNRAHGLINVKSGYVIDNSSGSAANGTAAIEYPNQILSNQNQQWYLNKTQAFEDETNILRHKNDQLSISGHNGLLSIGELKGKNTVSIHTITGQPVFSSEHNTSQLMLKLLPGSYILTIRGDSYYKGIIIL